MDPIRTAVKYALIPLRTVVQIGELYVEGGEQVPPPAPAATAPPKPAAKRRPAAKRTQASKPRQPAAPQASAPTAVGEERPVDLAREGKGRQPAPLGSNGVSS